MPQAEGGLAHHPRTTTAPNPVALPKGKRAPDQADLREHALAASPSLPLRHKAPYPKITPREREISQSGNSGRSSMIKPAAQWRPWEESNLQPAD